MMKLMWLLLFCSFIHVTAVVWENLAIDGVKQDTGYEAGVLEAVFTKYFTDIFPVVSTKFPSFSPATWEQIHFYLLLVYNICTL